MIPRVAITHHVKIYWVWLFLRLTSAALPIGMPLASLSYALSRSGSDIIHQRDIIRSLAFPVPMVSSIHTG